MSYEVTATRRRPQKFEDLAGQEFVAETFRNSIQSEKIAHAYLFSGPRGCGKTSTARILAKALNCAKGPTATPCGECQQCKEITKGTCTDVIEIDGASNTSVNDVRQIKDEVLFPPQSCKYKIYIIDEVHMLSTSAFNALLKTIEEPPPYVIFIFATTELQKVPATIKSRCQQFNFRLIPIEKVKEQLEQAAQEINVKADDEALYWIARESTGSMRDAYTLFDQVAAFSGNEITYDKIRDKLGLVGVDRLNEIFDDCAMNKCQAVLEKLDSFLQAGISIEQLIVNATDYLRSLLLIKNGITKEALLGQNSQRYSKTVLERWNPIQIERGISIFLQLYRDIRYSLSPRYELELAFSRLSWLSDYVSPAEVKTAVEKTRALLLNCAGGANNLNQSGVTPPSTATNVQGSSATSSDFKPIGTGVPQSFSYGGAEPPEQSAGQKYNFFKSIKDESLSQGKSFTPADGAQISYDGGAQTNSLESFNNTEERQSPLSAGNFTPTGVAQASSEGAKDSTLTAVSPSNSTLQQNQNDFEPGSYAIDGESAPDSFFAPEPYSSSQSSLPEQNSLQGQITDMVALKKAVISFFAVQNEILASILMQTDEWILNENQIVTTVASSFTQVNLQKKVAEISTEISKLYGSQIQFTVNLREQKTSKPLTQAPHEVQMVCSLFKGQIIAFTEKTDSAPKENQKPPENSNNQDTSEESDEQIDDNATLEDEDESV